MVRALAPEARRFSVRLPGELSERPRAIRFLVGLCRSLAVPLDVESDLVSAFGEAFNHAVLYSYGFDRGIVAVDVEVDGERIVVQVRDRGHGFDPTGAAADERRYGLFIMLRTMDEVRWYRSGDENVVDLVKRVPRGV
jgi:anti-sigma regulatory factor (Ser/Thr protein kinase)